MPYFGEIEIGYQEVTSLIDETRDLWKKWDPNPDCIKGWLEQYIEDLLPRELNAARVIGEKRNERRLPEPVDKAVEDTVVLVLLVGFSFEPLLQSICAYQPDKVLLVLNERYTEKIDGQMMGRWIEELMPKLLEEELLTQMPEIGAKALNPATGEQQFQTCEARPGAVFQFLTDHLLRQLQVLSNIAQNQTAGKLNQKRYAKQHIIIDITGAKKSMVSSAYLFGVLTNSRISYVDFDEYDPEKFRPFGYSCKIGEIDNPYRTFQLAKWGDVRRHYRNYAFGEAREALERMLEEPALEEGVAAKDLFKPGDVEKLNTLQEVLRFYESWDAGDVPEAYEHWISEINPLGIEAPMVVELLGAKWNKVAQHASPGPGTGDFAAAHRAMDKWAILLGTNHWQAMLAYMQDELAKIQRLFQLQGDARAAFIRAANLHEYTLKIRLIILTHIEDGINVTGGDIFRVAFFKASLAVHFSTDPNKPGLLQKFHERNRIRIEPSQKLEELNLKMFPEWDTVLFVRGQEEIRLVDQFREVRNRAVHSLSVITKKDAENAVRFIEKDWDNLLEVWAPLLQNEISSGKLDLSRLMPANALRQDRWGNPSIGVPTWPDLLGKCRIDFLPRLDDHDD